METVDYLIILCFFIMMYGFIKLAGYDGDNK